MVLNYTTTALRAMSLVTKGKPLNRDLWRKVCELGISRSKPTRRGCRAGHRRKILPQVAQEGLIQQTSFYYHQPLVEENKIWDNLHFGNQSPEANILNIQNNTYAQPKRKRGGGKSSVRNIPTLVTYNRSEKNARGVRNINNLIIPTRTPITPPTRRTMCSAADKFAVPKCMFLNICSLAKVKKGIRANVALEADLFANDIDICIVSETHLKKAAPNSLVAISNYFVHRRDQNWFGDKKEKGGIAIYTRNNVKVKGVMRSELYESKFRNRTAVWSSNAIVRCL